MADEKTQYGNEQTQYELNKGLARMLKGGVIMDVTTPDQAKIAEDAGACAVMALVPVLNAVYSAFNAGYYARWFYMPLLVLASMTARALETGRRKECCARCSLSWRTERSNGSPSATTWTFW